MPHGGELCRELGRWASFFLKKFLKDFGESEPASAEKQTDETNTLEKQRLSRSPDLPVEVASRQENNPAGTVATA